MREIPAQRLRTIVQVAADAADEMDDADVDTEAVLEALHTFEVTGHAVRHQIYQQLEQSIGIVVIDDFAPTEVTRITLPASASASFSSFSLSLLLPLPLSLRSSLCPCLCFCLCLFASFLLSISAPGSASLGSAQF